MRLLRGDERFITGWIKHYFMDSEELEQQIERELRELSATEGPFAFSRLYEKYSIKDNLQAKEIFRKKIAIYDPFAEPSAIKFQHARHLGKFLESTFITTLRIDRQAIELILERCVLETAKTTEVTLTDIYCWCYERGYQEGNRKIGPKILQDAIRQNNVVEDSRWVGTKPDEEKAPETLHVHLKSLYQFFKSYNDEEILAQTREELAKNVLRSGADIPYKGWISDEIPWRLDAYDIFYFFERERDDIGLRQVAHYCKIKATELEGKELESRHGDIFGALYYIGKRFNDDELLQLGREGEAKAVPSWAFLRANARDDKDEELMRLSVLEWVKVDPKSVYGASQSVNYAFGVEIARNALLEGIKINAYSGGIMLSILESFRRANDQEGISQLMKTEQYKRIKH